MAYPESFKIRKADIYMEDFKKTPFVIEDIEKTNEANKRAIKANSEATVIFYLSAIFIGLSLLFGAISEFHPVEENHPIEKEQEYTEPEHYYFEPDWRKLSVD